MLRIVCAKTGTSKCGQRVIVGDVASRAGMKVTEAQKALQALAADTNGFLEGIVLISVRARRPKTMSTSSSPSRW
ncbi:PREDICTED: uncharacterized protein At5g03900, chloroplastic-like isoform X2 [Brassica oleracea var. oleracea]|uniref:uncharacterized protein At5g03900, chloroplastic-like isoform X2 n=1 Tax=Brassica oleracea var. oleracea TaxID=109376 RepID=UPI0006A7287F|nr:PREDICTED: uncharacterized protein At5g03900, chloroplastic-like isoform X2 [Brassica oleracea var. oleracea]